MADKISKTIAQYKEFSQLQEYASAQETTILQLGKKLQRLEEERDHLKSLLESSVPLISNETPGVQQVAGDDSEYICTVEIAKLKNITSERELTYEESKRLDTYFKILTQINSKRKPEEREVKDMSNDNILTLLTKAKDEPK